MDTPNTPNGATNSPTAAQTNSASSTPARPNNPPTTVGKTNVTTKTDLGPKGSSAVDVTDPVTVSETPAEKRARLYKIKVDGQEEQVDLDSLTDEEIVKDRQWAKVARKRLQEKAEYEKQFNSFVEEFKRDPFKASKHPIFGKDGLDLMKMAEDRIIQEYQAQQLSPEARKAADLERQLNEERARVKKFEDDRQAEAAKAEEARIRTHLEQSFGEALEGSDLPRTHQTMRMMADVMRSALEAGIELTPEQMAKEVQGQIREQHQYVTRAMRGEQLIKYLGTDVVQEVLNYSIQKARAKNGAPPPPPAAEQKQVLDGEERPERKMQNPAALRKFWRGL